MKVIVAKFFCNGVESTIRDLTLDEITEQKKKGFLVKEQIDNYRPGFYSTRKQFLAAKGKNM